MSEKYDPMERARGIQEIMGTEGWACLMAELDGILEGYKHEAIFGDRDPAHVRVAGQTVDDVKSRLKNVHKRLEPHKEVGQKY